MSVAVGVYVTVRCPSVRQSGCPVDRQPEAAATCSRLPQADPQMSAAADNVMLTSEVRGSIVNTAIYVASVSGVSEDSDARKDVPRLDKGCPQQQHYRRAFSLDLTLACDGLDCRMLAGTEFHAAGDAKQKDRLEKSDWIFRERRSADEQTTSRQWRLHAGAGGTGKTSKFDATRRQILRIKCTKFDFRRGFVADPVRGAYSASTDRPPSCI